MRVCRLAPNAASVRFMRLADFDDIKRLFPAAEDQVVADVLALAPMLGELDAAAMRLADDDTDPEKMQHEHNTTLSQLLKILNRAHLQADIDR